MKFALSLARERKRTLLDAWAIPDAPATFVLREDVTLADAIIYHPSAAGCRYSIADALTAGDGSIVTSDPSLIEALATWPLDETGQPVLVALA